MMCDALVAHNIQWFYDCCTHASVPTTRKQIGVLATDTRWVAEWTADELIRGEWLWSSSTAFLPASVLVLLSRDAGARFPDRKLGSNNKVPCLQQVRVGGEAPTSSQRPSSASNMPLVFQSNA
jgi:hypothetical protein